MISGLREDYNEVTYHDRRNKTTQQNILTLHYENLYDKACELETAQSFLVTRHYSCQTVRINAFHPLLT